MFVVICWQNSDRNWWWFSFSSCTICSLYGWNFKSTWIIRRTHSRDNLTAASRLQTECRVLCKTETHTTSIFCGVRALLGHPVSFFFITDPVSSKFLIQVVIACFKGTWPRRPALKKRGNSLCTTSKLSFFWKTFLWRKHAVDHSTDPWLLNGEVVYSSRSLFCSAAKCTWLPLRISKVPVFLYHLVLMLC